MDILNAKVVYNSVGPTLHAKAPKKFHNSQVTPLGIKVTATEAVVIPPQTVTSVPISVATLKLMNSQGLVTGFDVVKSSTHNSDCAACIGAKMTRQPFPEINESQADLPGEKTHSDIWGPYRTQSLQGSINFISFIDDYSRQITVRFMKQKSETEGFVRKYIEYAEGATNNKPRAFKVDHATEYLKKSLVDWL